MWFYSDKPGIWDDPVNVNIHFLLNLFYIAIEGKIRHFVLIILQSFWVYQLPTENKN